MSSASNMSPNDGNTPGPIAAPRRIRWGGIIFFKVEGFVFEAPRYRFAEESEVFEDMFQLPTGSDEAVEGTNEEHPIALEGYKATDFDALLKVLYPTPRDLISGTFELEKEEWIGVLNLSTRWNMKQIRKHSINELSKVSLNPVEKVALGRSYKVARWFRDGLTELASEHPIQPLAELKSQLGAETVYTLLWAQNQALRQPRERLLVLTELTLSMLGCYFCEAQMFTSSRNCISCSRTIAVDDYTALMLTRGNFASQVETAVTTSGLSTTTFHISTQHVICSGCSQCALAHTNYSCLSCSRSTQYRWFKARPGNKAMKDDSASQKVLEEFQDEIASYESWDQ